jgi:hypothetical protein
MSRRLHKRLRRLELKAGVVTQRCKEACVGCMLGRPWGMPVEESIKLCNGVWHRTPLAELVGPSWNPLLPSGDVPDGTGL